MAAPSAERITARARKDPKFLRRALADPGLRAKLADDLLPTKYRKERTLQTRLNAPIAPGSTVTGRELAHQARAATQVQYGPVEADLARQRAEAQQQQRDVGGWYDQYQAQVAQGAQNVAGIQARTAQQLGALAQAPPMATPPAPGAQGAPPTQGLEGLAAQAAASRQNLVGSFQAQQDLAAAAQQGYMDQLAQAVAPAQKLGALAQEQGKIRQVGEKQSELAQQKGAFEQKTRQDILERQQNYGIAALGLGIKQQQAAAEANKPGPETTYQKQFSTQAAQHGMTPHQWALLGPKGRQKAIEASNRKASGGKGAGDHYGYSDAQWDKMSPDQKRKAYQDWQAAGRAPTTTKPADVAKEQDATFRKNYGVDPLGTKEHNDAKNSISQATTWIKRIQDANRKEHDASIRAHQKDPKHKIKPILNLGQIGQLLSTGAPSAGPGSAAIPQIPAVLVRAAMDLKQGGLTGGTAARLHKAGYKVSLLGIPNRPRTPQPTPAGSNTSYGGGAGAGSGNR
jgi:hypothetical protein